MRIASVLPAIDSQHAYWLYGDETHELMVLTDTAGNIGCAQLQQDQQRKIGWSPQPWAPGFPLHLFEDPELRVPVGRDRAAWLLAWHTEREWMEAVHRCKCSNGVIGITEELSPVAGNVPGSRARVRSCFVSSDAAANWCSPISFLCGRPLELQCALP